MKGLVWPGAPRVDNQFDANAIALEEGWDKLQLLHDQFASSRGADSRARRNDVSGAEESCPGTVGIREVKLQS